MFKTISIKQRITAAIFTLVFLTCMVGVIGQISNREGEQALQETYAVQLASAVALGESKYSLAIARVSMDRALLHPELGDAKALVEKSRDYLAVSEKAWKRYADLPKSAEEQAIASDVAAKRTTFIEQAIAPSLAALLNGDAVSADKITMKTAPPLALAFTKSITQLDQYLLKHGQENYDRFSSKLHTMGLVSMGMIGLGILVGVACGWSLQRAIARPLDQALRHFSAIASGDLGTDIVVHSHDEMGKLMAGLKDMRDGLRATVTSVRESADSMATATSEIASGNVDLSQRTEEQAASLEETAASMEQLTGAVHQNSENARQANAIADEAEAIAMRGGEVTDTVVLTMRAIQGSSNEMSAIISVIDGIAFQTNILALNAAVEAARAGEQGRGFAVVASEVRALAQRSATAAKEIKQLIDESVSRVGTGTAQVERAGATMQEVTDAVRKVSAIIRAISLASDEQKDGIDQVNKAVIQMDGVTQQNAALVEEAAAAAMSLQEQAMGLQAAVAKFRYESVAHRMLR